MLGSAAGLRGSRPCRSVGGFQFGVLQSIDNLREILLGIAIQRSLRVDCRRHRLAQRECGAHDGARDRGGIVEAGLCHIGLVLGAVEVVVVGIFAVVVLLASGADLFERGFGGSGGGGGLVGKDLVGEDFRGERGERGNATLEVVATGLVSILGDGRYESHVLPVGLHVRPLQVAGPEGDLAGVAGEGVRGLHGSGALSRHDVCGRAGAKTKLWCVRRERSGGFGGCGGFRSFWWKC